jgi:hypothetical protein
MMDIPSDGGFHGHGNQMLKQALGKKSPASAAGPRVRLIGTTALHMARQRRRVKQCCLRAKEARPEPGSPVAIWETKRRHDARVCAGRSSARHRSSLQRKARQLAGRVRMSGRMSPVPTLRVKRGSHTCVVGLRCGRGDRLFGRVGHRGKPVADYSPCLLGNMRPFL